MAPQHTFAIVNIIGGIAVLGSYAITLMLYTDQRSDFWGGINTSQQRIFVWSMLFAALGYLLFFNWVTFRLESGLLTEGSSLHSQLPVALCGIFLFFSMLWMPTTSVFLQTGNNLWWYLAVAILWVVSISLLLLLLIVLANQWGNRSWFSVLGMAGLMYLVIHCTIFDAIIWVNKFAKT